MEEQRSPAELATMELEAAIENMLMARADRQLKPRKHRRLRLAIGRRGKPAHENIGIAEPHPARRWVWRQSQAPR